MHSSIRFLILAITTTTLLQACGGEGPNDFQQTGYGQKLESSYSNTTIHRSPLSSETVGVKFHGKTTYLNRKITHEEKIIIKEEGFDDIELTRHLSGNATYSETEGNNRGFFLIPLLNSDEIDGAIGYPWSHQWQVKLIESQGASEMVEIGDCGEERFFIGTKTYQVKIILNALELPNDDQAQIVLSTRKTVKFNRPECF